MKRKVALGVSVLLGLSSQTALAQTWNESQPPPTDLQAGGLSPPPPAPSEPTYPPETPTEARLARADREDSGRGLEFFWLNGEVGVEHLGLQTFKAEGLVADVVESQQTGLVYGGGLGLRLLFLTLGARFRLGDFSEWQLWTLNGELGFRVPIGRVEPYFTLGGGYASVGSFSSGNIGSGLNSSDVDITGFNVRGGVGLDVYVTPVFSLGGSLTGEVLVLTRPGVDISEIEQPDTGDGASAAAEIYAADGSSIGSGVTFTAVAGLHF